MVGLVTFGLAAMLASLAQDVSGSPARQSQDIFDVRNKESDYFEHTFRNNPAQTTRNYSDALRFASCVAGIDATGAAAVLATDAGSGEESRAIRALVQRYKPCAPSRLSVPAALIRGAFAETLWKRAGADPNPARRTSIDMADVEGFIKMTPRGESLVKAGKMPIYWVSRCQVMALPDQSAKVLAAAVGSQQEKAEAQLLYANSKLCGVPDGLGRIPVAAVRSALADALYFNQRVSAGPAQ